MDPIYIVIYIVNYIVIYIVICIVIYIVTYIVIYIDVCYLSVRSQSFQVCGISCAPCEGKQSNIGDQNWVIGSANSYCVCQQGDVVCRCQGSGSRCRLKRGDWALNHGV